MIKMTNELAEELQDNAVEILQQDTKGLWQCLPQDTKEEAVIAMDKGLAELRESFISLLDDTYGEQNDQ